MSKTEARSSVCRLWKYSIKVIMPYTVIPWFMNASVHKHFSLRTGAFVLNFIFILELCIGWLTWPWPSFLHEHKCSHPYSDTRLWLLLVEITVSNRPVHTYCEDFLWAFSTHILYSIIQPSLAPKTVQSKHSGKKEHTEHATRDCTVRMVRGRF